MQTVGASLIYKAEERFARPAGRSFVPSLILAGIAAAIILAFVVSGNGSPVLVGRTEHNRAGAAGW